MDKAIKHFNVDAEKLTKKIKELEVEVQQIEEAWEKSINETFKCMMNKV